MSIITGPFFFEVRSLSLEEVTEKTVPAAIGEEATGNEGGSEPKREGFRALGSSSAILRLLRADRSMTWVLTSSSSLFSLILNTFVLFTVRGITLDLCFSRASWSLAQRGVSKAEGAGISSPLGLRAAIFLSLENSKLMPAKSTHTHPKNA